MYFNGVSKEAQANFRGALSVSRKNDVYDFFKLISSMFQMSMKVVLIMFMSVL